MSIQATVAASAARPNLALWSLMLAAFSIGVGEFVILGLLPQIGEDFGVSLVAASWLVTGYALGVAIGGPLMAIGTLKVPRRKLLIGLVVLFIAGTILCAWAPTYSILMFGRILAALSHGAFVGAAVVVATRLVSPEREGSAVATVIGGFTVATVIGVPLGTWVGVAYGWRAVFLIILGLSAISACGLVASLPKGNGSAEDAPDLVSEFRAVLRPQVVLALLITMLGFGGLFAAYTFLAAFLTEIVGFGTSMVAPLLFLFGIGAVVGNLIGGKAANRALMPTIMVFVGVLACTLIALPLVAGSKLAVAVILFLMGGAAFGATPGFQLRVVDKAREAPFLASTLNITAFNLGNALGAFLGGLAIVSPLGLPGTSWAGALLALCGVACVVWSHKLDSKMLRRIDD